MNKAKRIVRYAFDERGKNSPIELSLTDLAKIPAGNSRKHCLVTDRKTGDKIVLRRASCGLPHCMCALAIVSRSRSTTTA